MAGSGGGGAFPAPLRRCMARTPRAGTALPPLRRRYCKTGVKRAATTVWPFWPRAGKDGARVMRWARRSGERGRRCGRAMAAKTAKRKKVLYIE